MFASLKELYFVLSPRQRHAYLRLQILVTLMAFAEVAGVMSIGAFLALVGDMEQLEGTGRLASLYQWSSLETPIDFLVLAGVCALLVLMFASAISILTVIRLSMFGTRVGAELSSRLYRYYLHQDWLFHVNSHSSLLTNKIAQECQRITVAVINPVMHINAKLALAIAMSLLLFSLDPLIALIGIMFFATVYLLLYSRVKGYLSRFGETISRTNATRFNLMSEGFGGIKETLLLGRQRTFSRYFSEASNQLAEAQGKASAMGQIPRYAMELLAFSAIIVMVVLIVLSDTRNMDSIFPTLSMYALIGLKILPAFQQVYTSTSTIRNNLPAYENLKRDLHASYQWIEEEAESGCTPDLIEPYSKIELKEVDFAYPGSKQKALDGLSLEFPAHKVVGLVGESGSGKSTAIDMLMGLITPDSGTLAVDGNPITSENLRAWQNCLGYVAQSIFLSDSSIKENVAFGLHPEDIDEERVRRSIELSHLDDFVSSLPLGTDTPVGERGVQLSGGQRQRIGIARALYHEASVLVFDEATSALDSITEKLIVSAIQDFSGSKTIVMIAHRITTIEAADIIYVMKNGRLEDKGSFQELSQRSRYFRELAKLA